MSLGFEDCKVYISNVDCQGSAEAGILVQVIGELSNRGGPWRKFVQTFFLAGQPAGFFVLNDIQRYIKDEGEEEEDEVPYVAQPVVAPAAPVVEPAVQQPDVEQASETDIAESVPDVAVDVPHPNGSHHNEAPPSPISLPPPSPKAQPIEHIPEPAVSAPIVAPVEAALPVVVEEPASLPSPLPQEPVPAPSVPAPSVPVPTPAPAPAAAPTPAPAPAAPVAKSWADLAGAKAKQVPAVKPAAASSSSSAAPAASSSGATAAVQAQNRPVLIPAVLAINSTACFVKGVVETVNEKVLKEQLVSRYGPVRELDVVRAKACAFIEFEKVDGARRAIQASMRPSEGGEGGLIIGGDLMHVVTKASPGNRPSSSTRGGRTPGGEGRAGAEARGAGGEARGAGGEGRGAEARSNTSGNAAKGTRNAAGAGGAMPATTEEGATPKTKGAGKNGNRAKGNKGTGTATPAKQQ